MRHCPALSGPPSAEEAARPASITTMSCLGLPSGRGGPMSPSPSSLPRSPRVEVGLFLGRRRLSLPLAHFRHLSSATGAPMLSALHAALNAVSHSWCHAAENWCSLSASVSSFVKQISNGQGLFPALWSCATGMQTIFLFFHISQPGPYLCLQPRRWHRRQMMRAAGPHGWPPQPQATSCSHPGCKSTQACTLWTQCPLSEDRDGDKVQPSPP